MMKYLLLTFFLFICPSKREAKISNYESVDFYDAEASLQIRKKHAIFRIRYNDYRAGKCFIQLNMYVEKKKDTISFLFSDYGFQAETKSYRGVAQWTEDNVLASRGILRPIYYNPYVKYLKTEDKLTLLYVSKDMREFLAGNEILLDVHKEEVQDRDEIYPTNLRHANLNRDFVWLEDFIDYQLFPPEMILVEKISENILPLSEKNKDEDITGFKEFNNKFRKRFISYDKDETMRNGGW